MHPGRVLSISTTLAVCLFGMCGLGGHDAHADEIWAVRSGQTTIHFNDSLMRDLGLLLSEVAETSYPTFHPRMEEPHWTFDITPETDLTFRIEAGVPVPGGLVTGAIRHRGTLRIKQLATGRVEDLSDFEIAYLSPDAHLPIEGADENPLYVRATGGAGPIVFDLIHSMFELGPGDDTLSIHYLNVRVTEEWANEIGRPDLAGWILGMGELRASIEHVSGISDLEPYVPNFGGGFLDVKLGILDSIQQVGHQGAYPNGTTALSMATTSCNVGDVDVPWLAPMQEDHPLIHMALYRELDGRFEQVGISYLKHGFYALSNSQCTQCQHPSGGSFLGVGCSDTYGVGNNSDRNYLGPQEEVDPYQGTWECTGSHFAGGQPDCTRRHGGSGHSSIDHRVVVQDADLANANAIYYYESYYVVRDDGARHNNWGSRRCTMVWQGGAWDFDTPGGGNPLVEGPALERWGELQTYQTVPDDGQVLLAVETTDLGGGSFHYEYALLNLDSDRQIRSFSLPVSGVPQLTDIGFRDNDTDPTNDWQVTVESGLITWATEEFQNPDAHALEFGSMFNFRFDAMAAPEPVDASLGLFKPGVGDAISAATMGPESGTTAVVAASPTAAGVVLHPSRPNPLNPTTTMRYELAHATSIRLAIYDASGRMVRTLVDGTVDGGAHDVVWDGTDALGRRVGSGVYYARLEADNVVTVQPMVVVK